MMRMFNSKCLMLLMLFVVQKPSFAQISLEGIEEGSLSVLNNFVEQAEYVVNLQVVKLQDIMEEVQKRIMKMLENMTFIPSIMLDGISTAQNQITSTAFNTITSTTSNIQILIDSALSGLENSVTFIQEQTVLAAKKVEECANKFDFNILANHSVSLSNNILFECVSSELQDGQNILSDVYTQFAHTEGMIENLPSDFSNCLSNLNNVDNMTILQLLLERGLTMECLGRTVITVGKDTAKFTTSISYDGVKFYVFINTFPVSLDKCIAEKITEILFDAAQKGVDLASCVFDVTEINHK